MSFTQVPISGTINLSNATPANGAVVTFLLNTGISDGTTFIAPEAVGVRCNSSGAFSVTLNANDDSTTTPTGTYYEVTITYGNQTLDTFNVIVPHADSGGVDLFALAPLVNPNIAVPFVEQIQAGTNVTISPAGGTGIVTINASGGGGGSANVVNLGSSLTGTVTCELSQGVCFVGTMTGNCTFNFTNWPASPALTEPLLILTQDATGGRTITITGVTWEPSGTPPTFNTGAGQVNVVPLSSPDQGAHLYGNSSGAVSAATATSEGIVQLDGDLSGSASSPTVPTVMGGHTPQTNLAATLYAQRDYAAKGNGKYVTDAAITTGTPSLSSTQAGFTIADVGKYVYVIGAGASGADLVSTISSVSGGVATLAANASTTVSGAVCLYGNDDTTAIQDMLNALVNGGEGVFEDGVYIVAGGYQTAAPVGNDTGSLTYRAQLALPAIQYFSGSTYEPGISIKLHGQRTPQLWAVPGAQQGAVICSLQQSSATTYPGCMLGGPVTSSVNDTNFTHIHLETHGLTFRCPNNPALTALDCAKVTSHSYDGIVIDTIGGSNAIVQPTNTEGYGYVAPKNNCNTMNLGGKIFIFGYYVGFQTGEHTIVHNLVLYQNNLGIAIEVSGHCGHIDYIDLEQCTYGIGYGARGSSAPASFPAPGAGTRYFLDVNVLDLEHAPTGHWFSPTFDLDDPTNAVFGQIREVHMCVAPTGWTGGVMTNNGANWITTGLYDSNLQGTTVTTFLNSWADNNTGGGDKVAYWKDNSGCVHLRGVLKSGASGTAAFQLPAGYRPSGATPKYFAVALSGGTTTAVVEVDTSGNVIPQVAGSSLPDLSSIQFLAFQ